jgi:hypothetical protein
MYATQSLENLQLFLYFKNQVNIAERMLPAQHK